MNSTQLFQILQLMENSFVKFSKTLNNLVKASFVQDKLFEFSL